MHHEAGSISGEGHVLTYFAISDKGVVRSHNEDNFLIIEEEAVFCVADGAGGHRKGELASRLTLDGIKAAVGPSFSLDEETVPLFTGSGLSQGAIIEAAIHHANGICRKSTEPGLASTIVACHFHDGIVHIAHVGDSRAYRLVKGSLELLTEDHSLVNYLYRKGEIRREERRSHPRRNVILRAIGIEDQVRVTLASHHVAPGALYLLCSDGLTSMVTDERIRELMTANVGIPEAIGRALLNEANRAGGRDNITLIAIQVG